MGLFHPMMHLLKPEDLCSVASGPSVMLILKLILLEHWGKDPDMKIFGPMPHVKGNRNCIQHNKSSKFCICPRGHEVNDPRIVEAIFNECVPFIISDNFMPPFFEVLDWESFAVIILEKDISNLKNLLLSISEEKYIEMHMRVKEGTTAFSLAY
ncbi:unnamed protein product [Dovyalis caffra]|uniref:Exostosin GT47 domain-containing protein n=1 Tax=Dovyalis caffra TaxID=77055 RepID=A0AAV1RHP5_9ROSI|nr:unnamed protein product [Dovyalis caffra]